MTAAPQLIVFDLYNTLLYIARRHHPFAMLYRAQEDELSLSYAAYVTDLLTKDVPDVLLTHGSHFEEVYQ